MRPLPSGAKEYVGLSTPWGPGLSEYVSLIPFGGALWMRRYPQPPSKCWISQSRGRRKRKEVPRHDVVKLQYYEELARSSDLTERCTLPNQKMLQQPARLAAGMSLRLRTQTAHS